MFYRPRFHLLNHSHLFKLPHLVSALAHTSPSSLQWLSLPQPSFRCCFWYGYLGLEISRNCWKTSVLERVDIVDNSIVNTSSGQWLSLVVGRGGMRFPFDITKSSATDILLGFVTTSGWNVWKGLASMIMHRLCSTDYLDALKRASLHQLHILWTIKGTVFNGTCTRYND